MELNGSKSPMAWVTAGRCGRGDLCGGGLVTGIAVFFIKGRLLPRCQTLQMFFLES
jgi:hypothetical protein